MIIRILPLSRQIALCMSLLCAVLLAGCSNKSAMERVEYVLQSAEQEPEAALECISSINPNQIRGARDRARYALAYSEAMYYNRIDSDCDTLVTPMKHYYLYDDKHHAERARALYQYALVKFNHQELAESLFAIEEAHKSLDEIDNLKLRGLLCRTEGYIYYNGYLYSNAYEAHCKSKEYFNLCGLLAHANHATYQIGRMLSRSLEFNKAEDVLQDAKLRAIDSNDKYLLCLTIHELCRIYIQTSKFNKCSEELDYLDKYDCGFNYLSDFNCVRAMIAASKDDAELAYYYLDEAEKDITVYDELLEYANYSVSLMLGNHRRAIELYQVMIKNQNELIQQALKLPILNSQIDYLKENLQQKHREQLLIRQRNYVIYVIIAFIIVVLYLRVRYRMREQNRKIVEYVETIGQLRESSKHVSLALHNEAIALFQDYFEDLNKLCEIFHAYGESSRESVKVFERVNNIVCEMREDSARMQKLEQIVNFHNDDIITHLRAQTQLNGREIRFVIYTMVGFSTSSIALLLDLETSAVWRLKYKIKQKILSTNTINIDKIF